MVSGMPKQSKRGKQVWTWLSKIDNKRLDKLCEQLHQSRYRFAQTALLNAMTTMEQWLTGELQVNPTTAISIPTPLSPINSKRHTEESETDRQKRLHRQRMQALRLSNPAYAQAMDNKDHRAIGSELRKALKGIKKSEEQERTEEDAEKEAGDPVP